MKTVGIIAEYNPFHKGHEYHIKQSRLQSGADFVVVLMSGPFVQRGSCAIADKYTRAHAALLAGADLVLELPVLYACSSAEWFAKGAIHILDRLGIVSHLAFGCETTQIKKLQKLAEFFAEEPEAYRLALKNYLSEGCSFPKARMQAVQASFPELAEGLDLSQPNTILALEYCRAIYQQNSRIQPVAIPRVGGGYHQLEADVLYSSASSIRAQLMDADRLFAAANQFPKQVWPLFESKARYSFPILDSDLSALVRYSLMTTPNADYTPYLDVTEELSNRIRKHLFQYTSFHSFALLLKTKNLTYTRICRCLIHILLGITNADAEACRTVNYVPYFRLLGMKKEAAPLLGQIKKHTAIPMISNPVKHTDQLSQPAKSMLALDVRAAHIWNGIAGDKFQHAAECEYTQKFLKL